jgi:DNA-binding transcriptional regulator YiaG/putative component of toxin-antitoxin plasmid stabilization module
MKVIFYREDDGTVPLLEWLDSLVVKAQDKCRLRIERLAEVGHGLRRPEADYLRDGVYELRVSLRGIQYRMLCFFSGNLAAVVSHGIVKERRVPPREIANQRNSQGHRTEKKICPGSKAPYLRGGVIMAGTKERQSTTDAVEILHRRYYEGHPERIAALEVERANAEIARKIYGLRENVGVTQHKLAKLAGTTVAVIRQLEEADYEGHALAMLNRIAAALNKRVEIHLRSRSSKQKAA